MPVGSDPRPGSEIAGFRLEQLLGRGGMGAVYRAEDVRLGRKVALKLLVPELAENERFRERFLRESQTAASLDHPHIVPIYAAGEADGQLYLAMRYVEGADLRQLIAREAPLEPERVLRIAEQVGDALDAAHERGLIHRDVKPANVLVDERSGRAHCYLTDFGLTKQTSSISGLTGTGELVGTVEYVSPEQIRGEPVDGRADLYSLGCVLYECLTAERPFARESEVATLWAHVHDAPPPLRGLGGEIDQVMAKALAKAPADRYRTCGELVREGRAALGLEAPARRRRRSRRRRLARSRGLVTVMGAFLDPLADKVLVLGAMFTLVTTDMFWIVPVAIIAGREFVISVYRTFVASKGVSIPASQMAKWKTVFQQLAVGFELWPWLAVDAKWVWVSLLWGAVGLAVVSGAQYLWYSRVTEKALAEQTAV